MKKVSVSGCNDILHGGHLQFFEKARAADHYLIVSFASAGVLWHHKRRNPSIPNDHKQVLLQDLRMIGEVVITGGHKEGLDFEEDFLCVRPDFMIDTEDDKYGDLKREFCDQVGARYTVVPEIPGSLARKNCVGGHGGYVLYLFESAVTRRQAITATPGLRAVEPFCKV